MLCLIGLLEDWMIICEVKRMRLKNKFLCMRGVKDSSTDNYRTKKSLVILLHMKWQIAAYENSPYTP
jgi:hypothetical protein